MAFELEDAGTKSLLYNLVDYAYPGCMAVIVQVDYRELGFACHVQDHLKAWSAHPQAQVVQASLPARLRWPCTSCFLQS